MGGKRAGAVVLGAALMAGVLFATPGQAETGSSDQIVMVEPGGRWHIRLPGFTDYTFTYGQPGDTALLGDWNGDGIDTPGVYRPAWGAAHLLNEIPAHGSTVTEPDVTFFFGMPGDRVFAGDWDGDGIDTLGLSRNGRVFLAGSNATTVGVQVFWFGTHTDIPYAGDPDGNGTDGLFLHRTPSSSIFYTNDPTDGGVALSSGSLYFGDTGDQLIIGDWDGDGADSPGIFRPFTTAVHLHNYLWTGTGQQSFLFGRRGSQMLAGNSHLHVAPTLRIAPLTGQAGGDPSQRVLIAKISNSYRARPQAGIAEADLVMEVIVEGGVGRWIALYQTEYPEIIGPLRSVREVDPKLIEPFDGRVLHSGGQPSVRSALARVAVDEGNGRIVGYYREAGRRPVYDLMYNVERLPEDGWVGSVPPVLPFDSWIPSNGVPAADIDVAMSGPNTLAWEYADGTYLRHQSGTPSVDVAGAPITADSVVVVFVEPISTGRFDSAGQPVPDYRVVGSGEAVVFRNGRAWPVTWERDSTADFFRFVRSDGREIPMAPGRTWLHITPTTGSVDWS
ncbi:MAG: DUF3048 domain-containing protein [Acidimicrobiia bacterium]|nr:DUF3048 domain-containing protein [Acidimicrobiia bacterium]